MERKPKMKPVYEEGVYYPSRERVKMNFDEINTKRYPMLKNTLMVMASEIAEAKIKFTGEDREIIPQMEHVMNRKWWEYRHEEHGHSAEELADEFKEDIKVVRDALTSPVTGEEAGQVFCWPGTQLSRVFSPDPSKK